MAGSGKYTINIRTFSDSNNQKNQPTNQNAYVDPNAISKTIEKSLNSSMRSLERSITGAISKSLSNIKDTTEVDIDEKELGNTIATALKTTLTNIVNSNNSTKERDVTLDTSSLEKSIASSIDTSIKAGVKKQPAAANVDLKPLAKDIKENLPKNEVLALSKIVNEVSKLNKQLAEVPNLISSGEGIESIKALIKKLGEITGSDVVIKAKADVAPVMETLDKLSQDTEIKIKADVDDSKARSKLKEVTQPDSIPLSIDIDNDPLPEVYKKVNNLKSVLSKLNSEGIKLDVDTKAIGDLKNSLVSLINEFDYVKGALQVELEKSRKTLALESKVRQDPNTSASEKQRLGDKSTMLTGYISQLEKDLSSLKKVMDKVPELYSTKKSVRNPSTDLSYSQPVKKYEKALSLESTKFGNLNSKKFTDATSTLLVELQEISRLVGNLNTSFAQVEAKSDGTVIRKAVDDLVDTNERNLKQLNDTFNKTVGKRKSANIPDISSRIDATKVRYKQEYITPGADYLTGKKPKNEYESRVYDNMNNLSKSLDNLQAVIYDTFAKGLKRKEAESKGFDRWQILEKEGRGPSHRRAFSRRDNQWSMDLVNVNKLQNLTNTSNTTDPKTLLNKYTQQLSERLFKGSNQALGEDIINWLKKSSPSNNLDNLNSEVKSIIGRDLLNVLKESNIHKEDPEKVSKEVFKNLDRSDLLKVYAGTSGSSKITEELKNIKRTISIPAARVTNRGNSVIETRYGSQRSTLQQANYRTGHERAFDTFLKLKNNVLGSRPSKEAKENYRKSSEQEVLSIAKAVRKITPSTSGSDRVEYGKGSDTTTFNDVSKKLISALALNDFKDINVNSVSGVYKQAAVPMGVERQRITKGTSSPLTAADERKNIQDLVDSTAKASKTIDDFVGKMNEAGISATDVVRSLDSLSMQNMYDVLGNVMMPNVKPIIDNINTADSAIDKLSKKVISLESLMPIVESNAPRRGMHQGDVVQTQFQSSSAYNLDTASGGILSENKINQFKDSISEELSAFSSDTQKQKSFITDFNRRTKDLSYEKKILKQLESDEREVVFRNNMVNLGSSGNLSSLGLPESPASDLSGTDKPMEGFGDTSDLFKRRGKSLPMYAGNLQEISPFGLQFQQTGRNISGISSAKAFDKSLFNTVGGLKQDFPSLRSKSENKVIEAGRFGETGMGYNVIAELRHTAGTFEDQILVSGKLADAITTSVKKLVRPIEAAGKSTSIKEGPVADKDIENVSSKIMNIMGVDERYMGRADKALISEVKNELSTNRGETVEVQTAKLAELFLNNFGRKFTTRFGSKGVATTPTSPDTLADILSKTGSKDFNVLTSDEKKKAGLGVAVSPRNMGDLAAEILENTSPQKRGAITKKLDKGTTADLIGDLKKGGNKFMMDLFTNSNKGLVTTTEATKNAAIFERASKAMESLGIRLEQGPEGISKFKSDYSSYRGDEARLTEAKPIDIRISSFGAAKRGLQTEPLEMITNNLAGSSDTTVLKDSISSYQDLLGSSGKKGSFAKYSKALGYSDSGLKKQDIEERVAKLLPIAEDATQEKKTQIEAARKAMIELESNSSFYVDVLDELGKKRKSLVGKKFVSIVEEATQTEEWSKGAIRSHDKGIKLNIPAYAAYTSIFGENSDFMKEVNNNFTTKQAEHYDNLLTYLINTNKAYQEKFLTGLKEVDIKDLKTLSKEATPTFDADDPGSLLGSVFDTDAYPTAMKTLLPSTKGKNAPKEDLYIPRSISRSTYADPIVPGGVGLTKSGRSLQDVLDKGKSLEAFYNKDPDLLLDSDIEGMSKTFGGRVFGKLKGITKDGKDLGSPANSKKLLQARQGMFNTLSKLNKEGKLSNEEGSLHGELVKFYNLNDSGEKYEGPSTHKAFFEHLEATGLKANTATSAMKNLAVGIGKKKIADTSVMATAKDAGTKKDIMKGFSASFNDPNMMFSYAGKSYEEQVADKQAKLAKAKEEYLDSLRSSIVGKSGAIAGTFFTRNISAVLAKATNATIDKTKELTEFSKILSEFGGFDDEVKTLESLTKEHASNVNKYKEQGMPVLKQHELGISSKYADKLDVNFTKRYDEKSGKLLLDSEESQGSLKDLLTYVDKLKKIRDKEGTSEYRKNDLDDYINSELSPYIESVRFPFTGTSSVKPYQAKLFDTDKDIGANAVMVPGSPEMDMDKFEEVYDSVKKRVESLSSKREELRTQGKDEDADKLTGQIDKLNRAISDVLPKYAAHSQKLDFDGDQIEIHTAKTADARKDIYKHFKMLTQDIDTTAGRFEDFYASDAKQPSQGDLPLTYMSKAFNKKFDPSKGFSFLEKPFSTEDLEYLDTKQKIGLLASKEQDMDPGKSAVDAVNGVMRKFYDKSGAAYKDISGVDNLSEAADLAAKALESLADKDKRRGAFVEGYMKEELGNTKLDSAVNAQLFKINTGTDTESMTRLMRAYENSIGFGDKGDVGMYEKRSGKLDNNFLVKERNTQLNEFFRFAIQKGMDVKHAGESPVAGELVKGVTTGKTVLEDLFRNIFGDKKEGIEPNDSYGGLKDFAEVNEESLRNTFGKFSTSDLKEQIKGLGLNIKNLESADRPELIDNLVDKLGFKGFLEDLRAVLERQAAINMPKLYDKIPDIQSAYSILQEGYEKGRSLSVSSLVTKPNDPIYKMRTNSYEVTDDFDKDLIGALNSARNEKQRLGAYPELVKSFASLEKLSVDTESFDRLAKAMKNFSSKSFAKGDSSILNVSETLSGMEAKLGLAKLSDNAIKKVSNSDFFLDNRATDESKGIEDKEKYNEKLLEAELVRERFNRVSSVLGKVGTKGRNLDNIQIDLPPVGRKSEDPKYKAAAADIGSIEVDNNTSKPMLEQGSGYGVEPPNEPPYSYQEQPKLSSSKGPIPVYIADLNESLIFSVRNIDKMIESAELSEGKSYDVNRLQELASKASGGANELKDSDFGKVYRASGLHGGGKYSPGKVDNSKEAQIDQLALSMQGKKQLPEKVKAASLLGTGLHEAIEERMKADGVEIERLIRFYDEVGGEITGHIDAVLSDSKGVKTPVDIKTVGDQVKDSIGKYAKSGETINFEEIAGKLGNNSYAKYKIEEVRSQLNLYMAALKDAGEEVEDAEAHFYDAFGKGQDEPVKVKFKFDENVLKKDMASIAEARKKVTDQKGAFAKTGSFESLKQASKNEGLSKAERDELISGGEAYYSRFKTPKYKRRGADISPIGTSIDDYKRQKNAKVEAIERSKSLKPYPGISENAKLRNLELLRSSTKLVHKAGGTDFDKMYEQLPGETQEYITQAKDKGNSFVKDFLDHTQDMRIINQTDPEEGLNGKQISDAWKLYKDAVIEFLLNKAKSAEEYYEEVAKTGDPQKMSVAFNEFSTSVEAVQNKLRQDVGKRSDIYTSNKVFIQPEIAKAAGAFLSPSAIQRKSARDLGSEDDPESEKLITAFNKITGDLSGSSRGAMTSPTQKAREAVKALTEMNEEQLKLMSTGNLVKRLGPEITEAWDFGSAVDRITRLREALEQFRQFNVSDSPLSIERKNLENTIKLLKDFENKYSRLDMTTKSDSSKGPQSWGDTGVIDVPKWLDPKTQEQLNRRNLSNIREYYKTPTKEGGARPGENYSYDFKVFDDAGKPLKNLVYSFTKYGDVLDSAGQKVGVFNEQQDDLNALIAGSNRGMMGAIKRAVMWGTASTVVYGGVSKIREAIDTMSEIETSMAQLRMVMAPLGSDFDALLESAIGFSKEFGTPTNDVLKSMKVFAQQGLSQADIVDRTATSTLAGNVTTLEAKDATEALTAAMKIFRQEGESSIRFLDSWSEVESKHAITSGDMADGIKKAAAAARTAGFDFDQLNGVIAAIGSVTRQSGKEVGTSLRFIFRRLASEKGPQSLAKLDIPTITGEGEIRKGFDVLSDLADKWTELTSAQKLSIAQSIGGTRQYNSLLVLMDNWQEALDAVHDSMNSQGSAARKNQEIMSTYAKQVEQTKAAFVELQLSVGKLAFPAAKAGLKGMKNLAETVNAIPGSFKAAGVAALAFFTYLSKGAKIMESISTFFSSGSPVLGGLLGSVKDELKTASFEILGAGSGDNYTKGLKTLTAGKVEGAKQGKGINDFESALSKTAYMLVSAGNTFNKAIGSTLSVAGSTGKSVGENAVRGGSYLSSIVAGMGGRDYGKEDDDMTYKDLASGVATKYGKDLGIGSIAGLSGVGKIAGKFAGVASEVAGIGAAAGGIFIDKVSEKLGDGGDVFKKWAEDNSTLVQSIAPMLLTVSLLTPAIKKLSQGMAEANMTSKEFEKSMYGVKRADEDALKQTRNMIKGTEDLERSLTRVNKLGTPEVASNQKRLGNYRSPILEMADAQREAKELGNELAKTNLGLISGYDKLGNAVLRTGENFKTLLSTFEKSKVRDIAEKDVKIAAKHVQALTQVDGSENWKKELKDLTKEIPVIGDMISNQINLSPAKTLDILTKKINQLTAKKNASPLSSVFDIDIEKVQGKISKVKGMIDSTYSDFRRVLTEMPTEGLGANEIADLLGSKELRAGYEFMLDVEPKFNVKGSGKASWQDVLGSEVLKRVFPENNVLDATKELTTANTQSAGIEERQGKLLSGDIVTFFDEAAEKYDMAGNQAIVKLKETTDGVFNWVATYFNTKTLKVEEKAFDSDMKGLVDSVLPVKAIREDLSERIHSLNTFVSGAAAGLIGIGKSDFKQDFNLGERFYSDIATSSIVQGERGYNPVDQSFGKTDLQKGWGEDFRKYFTKPLNEYKILLEQLQKMRLTGLDAGAIDMSTELYDSVVKLQKMLRNNQVVIQYRAAFADLTKTLEASTRAMEENLAVEKSRQQLAKETSGLLKGKNADLANIDVGKRSKLDLSAQERLLMDNPDFEEQAKKLKELEVKRSNIEEQIYATDRTKVAVSNIRSLSKGFGSTISPEDLSQFTETVAKTGDTGIAELKLDTSKTAEHTKATVDRLDKILDNMDGDASDMKSSFMDFIDLLPPSFNVTKNERTNEALDRIASIRDDAAASGDTETLFKANKALDDLSKKLVDRLGIEGAAKKADSGLFGAGAFTGKELVQRAFSGLDFKTLAGEMRQEVGEESSFFGLFSKDARPEFESDLDDVYKLQKNNKSKVQDSTLFNSKNMAAAATGFGVYQAFNSDFTNKRIDSLDEQIGNLQSSGGDPAEIDRLKQTKAEEEKRARMLGTMRYAAGGASGGMLLARNLGMSEDNIKRLGAGGAALGAYGAAKLHSGMTGQDLPQIVKDFGKEVAIFAAAMKDADGGIIDKVFKQRPAADRFKAASEGFMQQFAEDTLDLKSKPKPTASDRETKYADAYDSFRKTKDDAKFDAEWKAKDWKRKVDNPNANLKENVKESVRQSFENMRNKTTEFKDKKASDIKESRDKAAERMATDESEGIREEARQVFKGAGIKAKEAYDKAKEGTSPHVDTAKAAGKYAKEAAAGVYEGLKEAIYKNTEAVNENTRTQGPGNAFGGYIQKFATGGTVRQVFPGSGDKQPSLLDAGELVLTEKQQKNYKKYSDVLKSIMENTPVMHSSGGIIDKPTNFYKDLDSKRSFMMKELEEAGLTDSRKLVLTEEQKEKYKKSLTTPLGLKLPEEHKKKLEEAGLIDLSSAKTNTNIAKGALAAGLTAGVGAYAFKGSKTAENFSSTLGKLSASGKDKFSNMDKSLFANPFSKAKELPSHFKAMKDVKGKGFTTGAKVAGKAGLKSAGLLGSLVTLGFAGSRALKGDFSGAGLELTSSLLSGTMLGSVGALGIQGYLMKRDANLLKESNKTPKFGLGGSVLTALVNTAKFGKEGTIGLGKGALFTAGALGKGGLETSKYIYRNREKIKKAIELGLIPAEYGAKGLYHSARYAGKGLEKGLEYTNKGFSRVSDFSGRSNRNKAIIQGLSAGTLAGAGVGVSNLNKDEHDFASGGLINKIPPAFLSPSVLGSLLGSGIGLSMVAAGFGALGKDDKENKDKKGYASGGYTSGMIRGKGTGTSDSIYWDNVPNGSFIIPSKYAGKAKDYIESMSFGGRSNSSDIRVSNGEYYVDPEDVRSLGLANLEKLRVGQTPKFALGGAPSMSTGLNRRNPIAGVGPLSSGPDDTETVDVSIDQESVNRLAQASAATGAFTLSRYAAEKSADKSRISTLDNISEDENQAIYDFIMERSKAADKVYSDLNKVSKYKDKSSDIETEEISTVLDTEKEYKKVNKSIANVAQNLNEEYRALSEEKAAAEEAVYNMQIAEEFKMQIEEIKKSIKDSKFAQDFNRSLKIGTGTFSGLTQARDFDPDVTKASDLNSLQTLQLSRKRKSGSLDWFNPADWGQKYFKPIKNFGKRVINTFDPGDTINREFEGQNVLKEYTRLEDEKNAVQLTIDSALQNRASAISNGDKEGVKKWNKVLTENKERIEDITEEQGAYGTALLKSLRQIDKAKGVFNRLEEGLNALSAIDLEGMYALKNQGYGGQLKGAVSGLSFSPSSVGDLSSEQFAWTRADTNFKGFMKQYKMDLEQQAILMDEQSRLDSAKNNTEVRLDQESNIGLFGTANESRVRLEDQLESINLQREKNAKNLENLNKKLSKNSSLVQTFMKATDAAKMFELSLDKVNASFYEVANGSREIQNKLDNLYGGSGAFAPQFVDVNKRRDAERYGVDLKMGKSDQFDIMRYELNKTLRSSNSGEERFDAAKRLRNIPQLKKDYAEHRERTQAAQDTNRSVQPAREYLTVLANMREELLDKKDLAKGTDKAEIQGVIDTLDTTYAKINNRVNELIEGASRTGDPKRMNANYLREAQKEFEGSLTKDTKNTYDEAYLDTADKSYQELVKQTTFLAALAGEDGVDIETAKKNLGVMDDYLNFNNKEGLPKTLNSVGMGEPDEDTIKEIKGTGFKELFTNFVEGLKNIFTPDKQYLESKSKAHGGSIGTMIKGPGTGTSDSIPMTVPSGSFIVQSKYANQTKEKINSFANGGNVPINVSNGELLLSPREVSSIGGTQIAEKMNRGNFASGGSTNNYKNPLNLDRSSWTTKDYNARGFANEKDLLKQMGGVKQPLLNPTDLLTGIGSLGTKGVSKGFSKLLKNGIVNNERGLLNLFSKNTKLPGYLDDSKKMTGASIDVGKYVKELTSNKKLHKAVMEKGKALYGKDTTPVSLAVKSGPVVLKNLVENVARKGYNVGGLVSDSPHMEYLLDSIERSKVLANDKKDLIKSNMTDIIGKNPELLKYIDKVSFKNLKSNKAGTASYTKGRPYTSLSFNTNLLTGKQGLDFPKSFGTSPEDISKNIMSHEIGHAAMNMLMSEHPEKYNSWVKALSEVPTADLTKYAASSRRVSGNDREAFAELFRLHNSSGSKTSLLDMDPKEAIAFFSDSQGPIKQQDRPIDLGKLDTTYDGKFEDTKRLSEGSTEDILRDLRDKKASAVDDIKRDKGFQKIAKASYGETAGKEQNRKDIIARRQGIVTKNKGFIKDVNEAMKPYTNRMIADQFQPNTIGKSFELGEPYKNLGKVKDLRQKNNSYFDRIKRHTNFITGQIKSKGGTSQFLGSINKDWREKDVGTRFKEIAEFDEKLERLKKGISVIDEAGGYAEVFRSRPLNEQMALVSQLYDNNIVGKHYSSRRNFTKNRMNVQHGKGTFQKLIDMEGNAFETSSQNEIEATKARAVSMRGQKAREAAEKKFREKYDYTGTGKGIGEEDGTSLLEKIKQYIKNMLGSSQDFSGKGEQITRNSAPVKHTGGLASSSGLHFLERGELVVSKNFKNGGQALSDHLEKTSTATTTGKTVAKLEGLEEFSALINDFESAIDKLTNIKIKGIDDLKDIEIKGIDSLRDLEIKGTEELRDIEVRGLDELRDIKVEGLADLRDIKIEGLADLRDISIKGIEELKDININTGSVGADKSDALAETLKDFDNRVVNLEESSGEQLNIIKSKVEEEIAKSIPEITRNQQSEIADMRKELGETISSITNVESTIKRFKQEISYSFSEVEKKHNSALTHLYSIKRV